MPRASSREISKSIEVYNIRTSSSGEIRGAGTTPAETPEYINSRVKYWRSLRKKIEAGARIRDDRYTGFRMG